MKRIKRRMAGIILIVMLLTILLSPGSFSAWADKTDDAADDEFDISAIIDNGDDDIVIEPSSEYEDKTDDIIADETDDFAVEEFDFADEIRSSSVGDVIRFGKYEQDGNPENGKEDIEWVVLNIEPERILVVSKYALDCQPYNSEYKDVTWETCSLRNWLNNDFKKEAFSLEEQEIIPIVTVNNADNPAFGTSGGNDTEDQIFCLSLEEMESLFGEYSWYDDEMQYGYNQNLICTPTKYAMDKGTYIYTITESDYDSGLKDKGYTTDAIGSCGTWWWLRSCGYLNRDACGVNCFGDAGSVYITGINYEYYAVRPALYISIPYDTFFGSDMELDNPIEIPIEEVEVEPIPGDDIEVFDEQDDMENEDGSEKEDVSVDENEVADETEGPADGDSNPESTEADVWD